MNKQSLPPQASGQKQRKPLTEKKIKEIWREQLADDGDYYTFARAIEAAHGIKEAS